MVGHHQKGLDRLSVKLPQSFEKLPNVDVGDLLEMWVVVVPADVVEITDRLVVAVDRVNHYQWVVEVVLRVVVASNNVVLVLVTILA